MSDEDARTELLGHLEGALVTEPKLIRYRTGRRRKTWEKNCVALGLAGGFVEPLESTSIHLIMIGVTRLIQLFPFGGVNDALAKRYNDQAKNELEKIRDFIILHYKLTERDDAPFWRRCREMEVPDSLAQRIALFRENALAWQDPDELFRVDSWVQVMLGQRLEPRGRHHMGRLLGGERLRRALDSLRRNIADAVARMPSHQAFLESYYAPTGD
jgi:tryptophan halogenase